MGGGAEAENLSFEPCTFVTVLGTSLLDFGLIAALV